MENIESSRASVTAPAPIAAVDQAPWLYRSEGFAEDLMEPGSEPASHLDSNLLRWGLPVVALLGVVGLAAAFSLA